MARLLGLCALIFAGLLPMSVMAQGLNWHGYYLGASVGGRFASNEWNTYLVCPNSRFCGGGLIGPDNRRSFDSAGVRLGAFGGRNWMLGESWLAGIEGEFGWASNRSSSGPIPGTTMSGLFPSLTTGDSASVNLSWDASLRARLGMLVRPDTLLFGTAGLALQQVEMTASCSNDGFSTFCSQPSGVPHYDSQTMIAPGWTIGAGVEHMLAASWLARLEYRYADFGQINPTFFTYNLGSNGDDRIFTHLRIRTHSVNLGVAYKF